MLIHGNDAAAPPKRVVVVGARGFVGNAIATRLERDGVPVLRIGRAELDLVAPDAAERLGAMLRPEDVLVAAAAMAPVRNPQMLRDNMILAAAIVAAAASAPLGQVVNIGSDAVYADSAEPLTEASPRAPESLHGIMHLAREAIFAAEIKAPLATLRPTLIYGAADPHNGYGPNRFRRQAAAGEPITLFGKGEERRDHVLIDDVAELAARVIYRRSRGALNIATGTVIGFREIADMVTRLSGRNVPIRETPRTGPMPHNGYRPFDPGGTYAAFPDFRYTPPAEGLAKVQAESSQGG